MRAISAAILTATLALVFAGCSASPDAAPPADATIGALPSPAATETSTFPTTVTGTTTPTTSGIRTSWPKPLTTQEAIEGAQEAVRTYVAAFDTQAKTPDSSLIPANILPLMSEIQENNYLAAMGVLEMAGIRQIGGKSVITFGANPTVSGDLTQLSLPACMDFTGRRFSEGPHHMIVPFLELTWTAEFSDGYWKLTEMQGTKVTTCAGY